ncbi:MAG: PQQ-binding-like beta-propeller repeat protein [Planctomycetes bacterium]|nr:PQQ-binding-like beta-propeller repeat protein [Planctomycetota bacterium]
MTRKLLVCTLILLNAICGAADWPRFLGPGADGLSTETGINKSWMDTPLKEIWRIPLSDEGYSGPAIVGDVVYILDHEGEQDVVRALNAANGQDLWRFEYAEKGDEDHGFSRSTPTVENDKLYTVSRTGVVHCLKTSDGSKIWRTDAMTGKPPTWGAAHSAWIHGDHVITLGVGENAHVKALNKHTGETVWTGGGTEIAGYATPTLLALQGKPQLLVFTGKALISVNPKDGTLNWRHPWKTRYDVNAGSPLKIDDNHVWIASGYRSGCVLLKLDGNTVTEVWKEKKITPHWSSGALIDGHIYVTTPPGYLVCVEALTGKEKWRSKGTAKGFEHGGLIAIDGTLIVIEGNTGSVVQVEVSTEAYTELGRINPLNSAKSWVAPVVSNKKLLVRSPKALVCLDLEL